METRGSLTPLAERLIPASHTIHIGRRCANIRYIALEVGHSNNPLNLLKDRAFRARIDEFTLVGRDGAEGATTEATTVDIYRVLDHLPRWDVALATVARVWGTLVRQVEGVVEFLGGEGLVGRCDDNIPIAHTLQQRSVALHHIAKCLYLGEVLAELSPVLKALLVGV